MELVELGYFGLFIGAFLAATILPFSSEIILSSLLLAGANPFACLVCATIGNSLGGINNYGIGFLGKTSWLLKLGMTQEKLQNLETISKKYGHWLAFFAWVPFIGDPLTIALGYFRAKFIPFILLMTLGKFLRYLAIVYWFF